MRERYKKGSLEEENSGWWLRYSEHHADGTIKRPRVFVGTKEQYPKKKQARLRADEMMREVNAAAAVTRFEHLCDRFEKEGMGHLRGITVKGYKCYTRALKLEFGKERVDHLASPAGILKIEAYLNGRLITASHRRCLKTHLGIMFKFAMKCGYLVIGANPIGLVDLHNTPQNTKPRWKRNVITPEQYKQLLSDPKLQPMDKMVISIQKQTGIRVCEALGLQWGDVDHAENKIYIRRSVKGAYIDEPKTEDSKRTAYLPEDLANELRLWKVNTPIINDWLFGSPYTGRPYTSQNIRERIKKAAKRYGFDTKGFGFHNARHTFRATLRDAGATPEQQMWAMGHSNLPTTVGYGQDGFDRAAKLAPMVKKVVSILGGKTGTDN